MNLRTKKEKMIFNFEEIWESVAQYYFPLFKTYHFNYGNEC